MAPTNFNAKVNLRTLKGAPLSVYTALFNADENLCTHCLALHTGYTPDECQAAKNLLAALHLIPDAFAKINQCGTPAITLRGGYHAN